MSPESVPVLPTLGPEPIPVQGQETAQPLNSTLQPELEDAPLSTKKKRKNHRGGKKKRNEPQSAADNGSATGKTSRSARTPCRLFNTAHCSRPEKCLHYHGPDEHSFQFHFGGPNNCKNHILGELYIGEGCKTKPGQCAYRHTSLDQAHQLSCLSLRAIIDKVVELVHRERTTRLLTGANCQDIDEYLKRAWVERADEVATTEFINNELERLDYEQQSEGKVLGDRLKKAIREFERNPAKNRISLRKALLEEDEDMDEAYFFDMHLRPKMMKHYSTFVPRGDKEQETIFRNEVKRMGKEICPNFPFDDDEEAWNKQDSDAEIDDDDLDDFIAAMRKLDHDEYGLNDDDDDEYGMDDEDGMFGFSHSDMMELESQGVKPWDDDAGDVLAALGY